MTDSTTDKGPRPPRTAWTVHDYITRAYERTANVDAMVARLHEYGYEIRSIEAEAAAPDAGLQALIRYDLDGDTFTPSKSGDYIMSEDVDALAAAPDAGLREAAKVMDAIIRHVERWPPAEDGFLDDLRSVRAALAADIGPRESLLHWALRAAPAPDADIETDYPTRPLTDSEKRGGWGHSDIKESPHPRPLPDVGAAPAGPAVHMRQSGNGCVTCSRKWSEHTDAEKR